MFPTFRQSMAWLHSWIGIAVGGLLFAVFFAGTIAVFDREIDRWMLPSTRIAAPAAAVSLDALKPTIDRFVGRSQQWGVLLPSAREPQLQLRFKGLKGSAPILAIDTTTGQVLRKTGTLGGSGFFLPFHYSLLITWMQLGYWIVGFAACALILALLSGVAIHARLLANLFTFRRDAAPRRRLLDLHNLTGASSLPFVALMAVSGLLVSYSNLMPAGINAAYGGGRAKYFFEVFENYRRPPAKHPAIMAPLDPMVAEAAKRWSGDVPVLVQVYNAGDANAYVEMRRRNATRITSDPDLIYFDGVTGQVLKATPLHSAMATQRWLTGLHMAAFAGWGLRWLYFALGLSGCVTIAAGMLVWLESRRPRSGAVAYRLTAGFVVACICGPLAATAAYLLCNRLLSDAVIDRSRWELTAYFGVWSISLLHALVRQGLAARGSRVWSEQAALIGVLAIGTLIADAVTTRGGLVAALTPGQQLAACVDGFLLVAGGFAFIVACRLFCPGSAAA